MRFFSKICAQVHELGPPGSQEYIMWIAASAVAAGLLTSIAIRFARVDFKLKSLEVRTFVRRFQINYHGFAA